MWYPNADRHGDAEPPEAADSGTTAAAPAADGLVPRLLTRWVFRAARVDSSRSLGGGLHRIELQGPALRGVRWTVGDKLQIKLGPGLQTRTYTPIEWDPAAGRTAFIAHALAWGPGSEWVRRARPGEAVAVFGPRRSLDLAGIDSGRLVLLGDETTIGLAAASRPAQAVLEVADVPAVQSVANELQLPATLVARKTGERHLAALADAMLAAAGPDSRFVLTGRASTVQALLRVLRSHRIGRDRIRTKAYWADGKVGLD